MVTARNARFQQWQALLTNRKKRSQKGEFLIQGERPLTAAVEHGWRIRTWLAPLDQKLSSWAKALLDRVDARVVQVAPELLGELGESSSGTPDLLAVARTRSDDLSRIEVTENGVVMVVDHPSGPAQLGDAIRSADAFGACGVVVTGHEVDLYDPKTIQASTGSLFALPVVRQPSHKEVLEWARSRNLTVVGTDENGDVDIDSYDLTKPGLLVVGHEVRGMTAGWRESCDVLARIPMGGTARSLGTTTAAGIVLYEAARQRRFDN